MAAVPILQIQLSHKNILFDAGRSNQTTFIFLGNEFPPEEVEWAGAGILGVTQTTRLRDDFIAVFPQSIGDLTICLRKTGFPTKCFTIPVKTNVSPPDLGKGIPLPITLKIVEVNTGLITDVNSSTSVKRQRISENVWRVFFDDSGQDGIKDWSMSDMAFTLTRKDIRSYRIDIFSADSQKSLTIRLGNKDIITQVGNATFNHLGDMREFTSEEAVTTLKTDQIPGSNIPILGDIIRGLATIFNPAFELVFSKFDEAKASVLDFVNNSQLVSSLSTIDEALEGVSKFFTNPRDFIVEAFTNFITNTQRFNELSTEQLKPLTDAFNSERYQTDEIKNVAKNVQTKITSSPITPNEILEVLQEFAMKPISTIINRILLPQNVLPFEEAQSFASNYIGLAADIVVLVAALNIAVSVVPRAVRVLDNMAESLTLFATFIGAGAITSKFLDPAFNAALIRPLEQGYNEKFPSNLPTDSELINEVVKEILPVEKFKEVMLKKGFTNEIAQRIFDAHFDQPALDFMIAALNRGRRIIPNDDRDNIDGSDLLKESGIINTDNVYRAMRILDFDPRFNDIWVNRFFRDPSITEARFLFESGAIDEDGVKDILKRNRLFPRDIAGIGRYITEFRSRFFERQLVLAYRRLFELGKITEETLLQKIKSFNYTDRTASLIIERASVNKQIAEVTKRTGLTKTFSITLLEDLLEEGIFTEEDVISDLDTTGYDSEHINSLISLLRAKIAKKVIPKVTQKKLTFTTVLTLLKKNLIDNTKALSMLKELGYNDEASGQLVSIITPVEEVNGFRPLPVSTILRFFANSTISEDQAKAKLTQHKLSEEDINLLIQGVRL